MGKSYYVAFLVQSHKCMLFGTWGWSFLVVTYNILGS